MKGCFIVFEGIDGSGKSTQFDGLGKKLKKDDYNVVLTREPTHNRPIGQLIRKILYNHTSVSEEALALLFAADRTDHTIKKIKPALQRNEIVLSDRYVYSSFAYQGKGMDIELNVDWLKIINRYAIHPDLVIFLDIPPQVGLERIQKVQQRVQDDKYFEDLIKQQKIRSVYYNLFKVDRTTPDLWEYHKDNKERGKGKGNLIKLNGTQVLVVEGTLPKEEIINDIYEVVKMLLKEKKINTNTKDEFMFKKLVQFS